MAFNETTGGIYRATTTSITNGTINNASYGYWLECRFDVAYAWGTPAASGLFGADVIYTISTANG